MWFRICYLRDSTRQQAMEYHQRISGRSELDPHGNVAIASATTYLEVSLQLIPQRVDFGLSREKSALDSIAPWLTDSLFLGQGIQWEVEQKATSAFNEDLYDIHSYLFVLVVNKYPITIGHVLSRFKHYFEFKTVILIGDQAISPTTQTLDEQWNPSHQAYFVNEFLRSKGIDDQTLNSNAFAVKFRWDRKKKTTNPITWATIDDNFGAKMQLTPSTNVLSVSV